MYKDVEDDGKKTRNMGFVVLIVLSLVLTTVVIANACYQKKQFYPAVIYIAKSHLRMVVS